MSLSLSAAVTAVVEPKVDGSLRSGDPVDSLTFIMVTIREGWRE